MVKSTQITKDENIISRTWISGKKSVTLIIDHKLAKEYNLTEPQYVVMERKEDGILIKKLKT